MDYAAVILDSPYGFHAIFVGAVLICVALVYTFGFKSPQEPEFEKLTDERKSGSKKKKIKDKKSSANGHVAAVSEKKAESKTSKRDVAVEKSPSKKQTKSPKAEREAVVLKENKDNNGNKKSEKNLNKSKETNNKENLVNLKNKKNTPTQEHDDGEWEQAVSRRDKRSKKSILEEILPQKNDKKKGKKKSDDDDNDMKQPDTKILDVLNEIGLDAEATVSVEEKPAAPVAPKDSKKNKKKKASGESKPTPEPSKAAPEPSKAAPEPSKAAPEPAKPTAEPSRMIAEPRRATPEPFIPEPKEEVEPVKPVEAKPPRQKKPAPPIPTPSTGAGDTIEVKKEVVAPPTDSNVVFDELGDSWKEAKAPKKSSRKKTRVD